MISLGALQYEPFHRRRRTSSLCLAMRVATRWPGWLTFPSWIRITERLCHSWHILVEQVAEMLDYWSKLLGAFLFRGGWSLYQMICSHTVLCNLTTILNRFYIWSYHCTSCHIFWMVCYFGIQSNANTIPLYLHHRCGTDSVRRVLSLSTFHECKDRLTLELATGNPGHLSFDHWRITSFPSTTLTFSHLGASTSRRASSWRLRRKWVSKGPWKTSVWIRHDFHPSTRWKTLWCPRILVLFACKDVLVANAWETGWISMRPSVPKVH